MRESLRKFLRVNRGERGYPYIRMHPSLSHLSHRPWPLPAGEWSWRQSWHDLAFLHYRVDPAVLKSRIPAGLELECFDGDAWVSVVPFRMFDVAPGLWPSVPPMRSFPELNVRTYVTDGEKPGVWFFSLDADCWPIVFGGRVIYGLPYHRSRMSIRPAGAGFRYQSIRRTGGVAFEGEYAGTGETFTASPGSLEHWLAERYCLYAEKHGRMMRVHVHHPPWPLQRAEFEIKRNELLEAASIEVRDTAPICHFSPGVSVVSYQPESARRAGGSSVAVSP